MNLLFSLLFVLSTCYPVSDISINIDTTSIFTLDQDDSPAMVTLTELFNDSEKYRNQSILVKGKVVKINPNILGKNWVHIQDGSKNDEGEFHDLTITSQEVFEVNDEVVIKGKIVLDKNFGAGYIYEVIMEEGESYKKKI